MTGRWFSVLAGLLLPLSCALCGDDDASGELERLRRENAELRSQLLEERTRARDQALFLAAVADEGEFSTSKDREAGLLTRLSLLCSDGGALAVKVAELTAEVRALLRDLPVDTASRARIRLQLDELERRAGAFAALIDEPAADSGAAFRECRVLALNRELEVAVLDIGSRQGAFVGLVLRGGPDKSLELRLDDVRPGVSAATVLRGNFRDLVPGMSFNAENRERR